MENPRERMRTNVYDLGKIPPQAVDIEEVILGALMIEKTAIDTVGDLLRPEMFYKDSSCKIYEAISNLRKKNQSIDLLVVTQELRKMGMLEMVGGAYYITMLTSRVASAANIENHARIVFEKFLQREVIRISSEAVSNAFEENTNVFELLDKTESELFKLQSQGYDTGVSGDIKVSVNKIVNDFDKIDTKELDGIDTGNEKLNKVTGGFQNTDLIILAARPAVGKTSRALKIASAAWLNQKKKGIVFSLEMGKDQIVKRLIADAGNFHGNLFRNKTQANDYDFKNLNRGASLVYDYGFEVYDNSAVNINFIRTICKKFKKKYGQLDYIIIDYLQLMTPVDAKRNGTREQEVSQISAGLKKVAKDFDIPVIALSQLSRDLEKRSDKRPMLSDLRESGSLEQDADLVIFLYKPSIYYDINSDPDYKDNQIQDVLDSNYHKAVEVLIAKHRNGDVGANILEEFTGEHFRFNEWGANTTRQSGNIEPNEPPETAPF